ncbi:LysR family transcriptional regulator [Shewanella gelidii]|uniref:LysR family transcriptional regulator n=1 Tax=Shewanella gelidii TaxID=1642821 RepID=A0A917N7C1_9GAMM|nr:LysR family transcriptional regulator [Shewanella gelidii]MCL1096969.1 LysR family transcriptional regulator [Shewanella gelidii]GGI71574.1 LysR family transcriptional regulator [Shewanella gelidii]
MLNQVNLSDLRAFVLIAQLGSFTQAAGVLQVSRSHVSRQLSALEKQLGVTLITRTTRRLNLTDTGKTLFAQCQTAFTDIEHALLAAVDDNEQLRGNIRLNCVGGFIGEEIVADIVHQFMGHYPHVSIALDFSSHRIDLIADEFDIAFRMGKLQDASFIGRHLLDIEMVTLASPKYLQQHPPIEHPKQLSQHRCLTGSVTQWCFHNNHDKNQTIEIQIQGRLHCKNGRALIKGALANNGIIRVPKIYCQHEIEQGLLQPILENWHIAPVPLFAIYQKDKYQPQRLRDFIEFTLQALKSTALHNATNKS